MLEEASSIRLAYIPPAFTRFLSDTVLTVGSNGTFEVEVQGEPEPVVSWFLNEKKIENDKRLFMSKDGLIHTLNIINVSESDASCIKCVLRNDAGTESCTCSLKVASKLGSSNVPSFTSFKENLEVLENHDAVFVVEFTGDPMPEINWYRDLIHLTKEYGVDVISGSGRSKMILPEVSKDDSGVYSCFAKNAHGEVKCSVYLDVITEKSIISEDSTLLKIDAIEKEGPPVLLEQFQDKEVYEGDIAVFQVKVACQPKPIITWFHCGNKIESNSHRLFEEKDNFYRLVIPISELSDDGEYMCTLKNAHGEVCCKGNIVVHEGIFPPKFVEYPKSVYISTGQSCTLHATIKGKPPPTVEWYKDNRQLTERNGFRFQEKDDVYSIVLENVTDTKYGAYKCSAFNNAGESACVIEVLLSNVNMLPEFIKPLSDIKTSPGNRIRLDVTVTGSPSVSWYYCNDLIGENDKYHLENASDTFVLFIDNILVTDGGVYKCQATNSIGDSVCECHISVSDLQSIPQFLQGLTSMHLSEHSKGVEYEVVVTGYPQPDVLFYKDGAVLESSNRRKVLHKGNVHILQWKYVLNDDTGAYTAVASNSAGETLTQGNLLVDSSIMSPEFFDCQQHYNANERERVVLTAAAKGIPTPYIQWFRNDRLVVNDEYHDVQSTSGSSQLTIKSFTSKAGNEYKCVATNTLGSVSLPVIVVASETKKFFPPEFSSTLTDVDVQVGKTASLQIGVIGYPEPSVVWKKDGNVLVENKNISISFGNGVYLLALKNCQREDAGCYECIASNPVGESICQCLMTVSKITPSSSADLKEPTSNTSTKSKAPKFLECFRDLRVIIGEPILLETIVTGDPFPDIRWYRQDKLLHSVKRVKTASNAHDGRSYFKILAAMKDDAGEYECVAKNKHGEASISCEVYVDEKQNVPQTKDPKKVIKPEKPKIIDVSPEPHVMEGDEINFSLTVCGNPQPKIEIFKEGKLHKPPPRVCIEYVEDKYTFHISESRVKDEAIYEFVASNDFGKDSVKVEILVDETGELEVVKMISDIRRLSKEEQRDEKGSSTSEEDVRRKVSVRQSPKRRKSKKGSIRLVVDEMGSQSEDNQRREDRKMVSPTRVEEDVITEVLASHEESLAPLNFELMNDQPPQFIEALDDLKTSEGKPIKLIAKVTGVPEPNIKWMKDGKMLGCQSDIIIEEKNCFSLLKIVKAKVSDSGDYVCVVENSSGATSKTVNVKVNAIPVKPDWTKKLQDISVIEGETIVMDVMVSGHPPPDVQFMLDNRVMQNSDHITILSNKETGKHQFTIEKSVLRDSKTYKCTARNNQGTISCLAAVKVQQAVIAPQFLNQLQDCEFMETRDLKLKLEVSGKPKPLLEWFFNEQLLKPSHRIKVRTERDFNTLQITSLKLDDTGNYKAVCSNIAGEISTSCNVIITEELKVPDFVYTPKNMRTVEGRAGSLRVSFNGKPEPQVTWLLNDTPLKISDSIDIKTEPGKATISMKNVELKHAGMYTCVISNKCGSAKCNVELAVDEAQCRPSFIEKLKEAVFKENSDLKLSVEVKGKPKPNITWFKDDGKIVFDDRIQLMMDENLCTLCVLNCTLQDAGQYKVLAKNVIGESSCKAKIFIEEKTIAPVFTSPLTDTRSIEGDAVEFSVSFEGKPKPRLRWLKDNNDLEASRYISISTTGFNGSLKLSDIKMTDSGTYECVAQNKDGVVKCSCLLEVQEALSEPVFTKKPHNEIELTENELFSFDFAVKGNPCPNIEISKNGKNVSQRVVIEYNKKTGSGIVKIETVAKGDEGLYKVTAVNSEGSVSSSVCLQVHDYDNLMFIQELCDTDIEEGADALMEVRFSGNVVDVDWYKDNEYIDESEKYEIIDEEDRCTCIVHNCSISDSGLYRCEILNEKRSQSCSSNLNVQKQPFKPSFGRKLSNMKIEEGNKVILDVQVEGYPEPECKWYKDGVQLNDGEHIKIHSDDDNRVLTIPVASVKDTGNYVCKLYNTEGSAECSGKVDVAPTKFSPVFTTPLPSTLDIFEGKECEMEVSANGNPRPKLTFYKDGEEIKATKRFLLSSFGKDSIQLKIKQTSLNDEGEYSVKALNSMGATWSKCLLLVQMPETLPKFVSKPKNVSIIEGEDATFKMNVTGHPAPSVKVLFNTELIKMAENNGSSYVVDLKNCAPEDTGKYKFEASNNAGQSYAVAELFVQEMAKRAAFEQSLHDLTAFIGDDVVLEVSVDGIPAPMVSFFKNKRKITDDKKHKISVEDNRVILTICKAELGHSGNYSCEIRNEAGHDRCEAKVSVIEPPSKPSFSKSVENISIIEGDSISLEVNVDGNPAPDIVWLKDEGLLSTGFIEEQDGEIRRIFKAISELSDQGTYIITASNENGEISCSAYVNIVPIDKPPFFQKDLIDQTLTEGDKLLLEVLVGGYPSPQLHWCKDDVTIEDEKLFKIDVKNGKFVLKCNAVKLNASGVYKAIAVSETGECSSQCEILVQEKPVIPKFGKLFSNQTVEEGKPVSFSVQLTGTPKPVVTWYRGDQVLTESENIIISDAESIYQLDITEVSLSHGDRYECVAKNVAGEISHSAKLKVKEIVYEPVFESCLSDIHGYEGQEIVCAAVVKGSTPFVSKWTKNGKQVHKTSSTRIEKTDNNFILRIPKPVMNDSGVYGLEVSNSAGSCSTSCKLDIKEAPVAPSFIIKLRDVHVVEGKEAEFNVKITGKPEPSISWYLNDEELTNNKSVFMSNIQAGKAVLRIKPITLQHAGKLRCDVINTAGNASSNCKLKVSELTLPPEFTKTLQDVNVVEGEDVILKVIISGKPQPTVAWSKNRKDIKESRKQKFLQDGQEYSLIISDVDVQDQGKYRVTASNKSGEKFSVTQLTVSKNVVAPVFITLLENMSAKPSENLTLFTEVVGTPTPAVHWLKDGKRLQALDRFKIEENDGSCKVQIKDVRLIDGGVYSCVAVNEGGEVETEAEVEIVQDVITPEFTRVLKDCILNENEDIVLSVNVHGIPIPEVNFYKDKKVLQNIDGISISTDDDGTWKVIIEDAQVEDSGVYECKAHNTVDEIHCSCLVEVNEAQVKPSIVPIEGVDVVNVNEGGDATFEAQIYGNPFPLVDWAFGEILIDPSDKYELIDDDGYSCLIIHDANRDDEGDYACIAASDAGEVERLFTMKLNTPLLKEEEDIIIEPTQTTELESAPSFLDKEPPVTKDDHHDKKDDEVNVKSTKKSPVLPPVSKKPIGGTIPTFSMKPKTKDVMEGFQVRFTCNSSATPDPILEWFANGRLIETGGRHLVKNTYGLSTLIIKDVCMDDIGKYKVVSKNDVGEAEAYFCLSINGMSSKPEEHSSKTKEPVEPDLLDTDGPIKVEI